MNVRCPQCQSVFRVDPEKVPVNGIRARCARCNATFSLSRSGVASTPRQEGVARPIAAAVETPAPADASGSGAAAPAAPDATAPTPEPAAAVTGRTAFAAGGTTGQPRAGTADAAQRAAAAQPTPAANSTAVPSTAMPSASAGLQAAPAAPASAGIVGGTPPSRPQDPNAPSRTGVASTGTRPTGGAPKRASFAKLDPNVRAQRLARALVSDIVAYNKEKREAALRGGTLKNEFREEIRKSWEEYVAQVGLELARSTPFFRDSLNEILAKGQPLF